MYTIIKVQADYADEFEVYGVLVLKTVDFENRKEIIIKTLQECYDNGEEIEIYFGSNEELQFRSVRDFEKSFSYRAISTEEKKIIDILGLDNFGSNTFNDLYEECLQYHY